MKQTASELFGDVLLPASFKELIAAIQTPVGFSPFKVFMWRGQGDITWPIHSSAYRRLALDKSRVTEQDMCNYEKRLLNEATHSGYRSHEGRDITDLELLAKLQHHGAATRLIDTSRNALIALYFCVSTEPQKTGLLIGFHSDYIGGTEGEPDIRSYDEIMKSASELHYPQTWAPTSVSSRIAAQHSQFLYSSISPSPQGSLWLKNEVKSFLAIGIKPKLKVNIKSILKEYFDIYHLTLFPDIDGFSHLNSFRYSEYENYRW